MGFRFWLVCGVVGVLAVVAGCGGVAGAPSGTASSVGAATASARSDATSPATPPPSAASPLTGLDPCDLLSAEEADQFGMRYPGEPDIVGGAKTCLWIKRGNGNASVAIQDKRGVSDFDFSGAELIPIQVGGREVIKVPAPLDAKYICHVLIPVTDSSSVQIIGTLDPTPADTDAACDRAIRTAEFVIPRLP